MNKASLDEISPSLRRELRRGKKFLLTLTGCSLLFYAGLFANQEYVAKLHAQEKIEVYKQQMNKYTKLIDNYKEKYLHKEINLSAKEVEVKIDSLDKLYKLYADSIQQYDN